MLVPDALSRIKAEELDTELRRIEIKAQNNSTYLLGRSPPTLNSDLGVNLPMGKNTKYAPTPPQPPSQLTQAHEEDTDLDIQRNTPSVLISEVEDHSAAPH